MPAPIRPERSERRRQRPGLAHQGAMASPARNHRLGAEPLERGPGVHREDDADGDAGHGDERRGPEAELVGLADGFAQLEGREKGSRAALKANIEASPTDVRKPAALAPSVIQPPEVASGAPTG